MDLFDMWLSLLTEFLFTHDNFIDSYSSFYQNSCSHMMDSFDMVALPFEGILVIRNVCYIYVSFKFKYVTYITPALQEGEKRKKKHLHLIQMKRTKINPTSFVNKHMHMAFLFLKVCLIHQSTCHKTKGNTPLHILYHVKSILQLSFTLVLR